MHTPATLDLRPMLFFLSQAMGIMFEDGVIALGRKIGLAGHKGVLVFLGYAWVWCWFVYSVAPWWDEMAEGGVLDQLKPGILIGHF